MGSLHRLGIPLALSISCQHHQVRFGILCKRSEALLIERAIRGSASWDLDACDHPLLMRPRPGSIRLECFLTQAERAEIEPLRDVASFEGADPLSALLSAALPLQEGEGLDLIYQIRPAPAERIERARRALRLRGVPVDLLDVLFSWGEAASRLPRFEPPALQRLYEQRLQEPLFELIATISLTGTSQERLHTRRRSVEAVFAGLFSAPGFPGLSLSEWRFSGGARAAPIHWPTAQRGLLVTAGELGSFYSLPSERTAVPGLFFLDRPSTFLPPEVVRNRGLLLGTHRQHGERLPVHLSLPDLRSGHLMLLGMTGVGKTTLGHQLLAQCAALPGQPSIVLIDRHRTWATEFAAASIPGSRTRHGFLLDLADVDYPPGLPLFRAPNGVSHEAFVETTFSLLRLIFREQWSPTRMEDAIYALTATLCRLPDATLLAASRLLHDPTFRRKALVHLQDPVALEWWAAYEALSESGRRELTQPILYRLRSFTRSRAVRNIICRTDGADLGELVEQGSILAIIAAGQEIQAEADLLGELVISRLQLSFLSRLSTATAARPTFLAIDESQHYKGPSLPTLLGEARKTGLCLLLITQHLKNWSEALSEAILGNVGTQILFRLGPNDSAKLAHSIKPFTPDDLENLNRFEALVKMQVGGQTMPAFDIQTLPIRETAFNDRRLEQIRTQSRQRFGKPRQQVEELIRGTQPPPAGPGEQEDIYEE